MNVVTIAFIIFFIGIATLVVRGFVRAFKTGRMPTTDEIFNGGEFRLHLRCTRLFFAAFIILLVASVVFSLASAWRSVLFG